jgi:hypothetical protein
LTDFPRTTETADGIDGAHALKPDLIGCDEDVPSNRNVCWPEIRILVEVKDFWSEMVAQAASLDAASQGLGVREPEYMAIGLEGW